MRTLALAFFALGIFGCGDSSPPPAPTPQPNPPPVPAPPPPPPPPVSGDYEVIEVRNGGELKVSVYFKGRVPKQKMPEADAHCAASGEKLDDLVVSDEKLLRDAVVYLSISKGKAGSPGKRQVIDQQGCIYKPHVVLCWPDTGVEFTSSDPVLHNVHILANANKEVNTGVQQGGRFEYVPRYPEFIRVKCDVHPWMNCHIIVQEHPYYALTGADGLATLADIPPGTYKVRVWHPRLAEATAEAVIVSGESAKLSVELFEKKE